MDRKRKADDPCDVTVPKKSNLRDVTDKMDRKRKADDSGDDTVRKKSSVDDELPTPQGSSQSTSHDAMNCSVTGMTGGTAINSKVAGVIYEAAECSLLQHLIAGTSLKIRSRDSTKHVPTYTERAAYRHLKACGSVIIRGRSGSGKSHLGYTLLERIAKSSSRIPLKVSSPDEWNYIHKSSTSDEKFVVLVDDIFGRTNLIQSSLEEWRKKFDVVWPFVESGQIWLVVTSRPEIITQGEPEIFGYEVINKSKEIILDDGVYRLREEEKLQFLDKLCGKYVRKEDMKEIANMDTALGFPQCCTFFATNKEARSKGVEFFKKPFEFIKYLIDCVKNDQPEVYFVLLLVFMNEGRLSMEEFMSLEHEEKFEMQYKTLKKFCRLKEACPSTADIKCTAESVCGVYLCHSDDCFQFSHRSIYDVMFVALCEACPDLGIRMSTPLMLLEFIRTSAQKEEGWKQGNVVFLAKKKYPILVVKVREYLSNENNRYIILSHPALQDTEFLHVVFQEWEADDIYQLSRHKGEKVVKDIAIPLSKKLGMPQTVNILEYCLFLSHVIMSCRKEFALSLIQSLCGYESEDIQPIFNEALLCAVFTCQNDLVNALLSNGAKPNKLCFRALCNSPRIDPNTSTTITRQIECNATDLKLLLVLAICCCNKTVIRVLVQRLTAQSEDHKQFYSHCIEMLLRINGNGHMDVTEMMTNTGSDILEVMTLLEEGGGKLDSRKISLASTHKDSTVLGKLLLRSSDGIHVTDEFGRTPLHLACMYGSADGVKLLLKHGAELTVDQEGATPFHSALKSSIDQKEKLKLLLDKNSTNDDNFINLTDNMKCTALHYAAQLSDSGCVKMLVEAHADINVLDVSKQSSLFYASKAGIPESVDILCKSNAIISKDIHGLEPVHYAAYGCDLDVLKIFIQNDCNTSVLDHKGRTLLHYTVTNLIQGQTGIESRLVKRRSVNSNNMFQCIRELIATGLNVNIVDKNGRSCVLDSTVWQGLDVVRLLCENGADINWKDKSDRSIITESAVSKFDSAEKIQYLMGSNCFRNIDDEKQNALYSAVLKEDEEAFEVLVDNGITINQRRHDGATLLHDAARHGLQHLVSRLMKRGASVISQDDNGDTPLHLYLMNDFHDDQLVEDMINSDKSIVRISNNKNQSLLHLAIALSCSKCISGMKGPDANAALKHGSEQVSLHLSQGTSHRCSTTQRLIRLGVSVIMQDYNGNTALSLAVMHGCKTCVSMLCDNNADPKVVNKDGYSALHISLNYPGVAHNHQVAEIMCAQTDIQDKTERNETSLHLAVSQKCFNCVTFLLENGLMNHINHQDRVGDTALHIALQHDTLPSYTTLVEGTNYGQHGDHSHVILQALIEKGADACIKINKDKTPLHCAALRQCIECVKLLLPVSDVKAQNSDGNTALHCSLMSDKPHSHEVIQALVEKGADVGIKNKEGEIPLHCAASEQCVECVKLLLPVSDVNAQDSDGDTALHCSVLSDKPHSHEVIHALVEKGADVGIKNKKDKTPLHCAARRQCIECVKLLLPVSDVKAQDSNGNTALHCSLLYKLHSHEVIQALVEKGDDVGIKNKKDKTPLHCAARRQCIECVKLLLPVSDVNAQDSDGDTALHCSLLSDKPHCHEVIQALVEKGADVGIKNKKDQTPLHCAARRQCMECVKLFLPVSDVNAQDSDGNTALHCILLSYISHSHEVIQALVEKGADVGIKNKKDKTPLHCAARRQCIECVKLLLPVSDVNAQDSDGNTALHCILLSYISHSHEVIQALVEKGADVRIKNKEGKTPLHCAARQQCLECVKLLLPVSDVNAQDSDGDTALHCSVLSDKPHSHEVIQTLVEKGADVGIKNKKDQTPLHCAARRQCMECVKLFLPVSDVNAQDSDGNTALHCSLLSDEGHSHEVIQALVEKGADVGIKNKEGETPLHCAASEQCVECVKLLLPVSDVNAQDSDGNTALHCILLSYISHSHEVIQALVEKGADVGIKNKEGKTPLHCAARQQCLECVKLLLPVSDVNAQDSDGDTALHCSLLSDKPHSHEVIQTLVEKGADVGIKNKKDQTPLHCAARRQCMECVKLFLPVSDVNAQDSDGDTALHSSLLSDKPHSHEVIQALVEKGADVGIKNKKDKTPLHCAAMRQCIECVKLLLPVSDVNAQDSDGNTALHCILLSYISHYHEVIQALVEKGADVGIKNKEGETPLHCAARQQCIECVKRFLPVSDVNAQVSDGNTALHNCFIFSDYKPHSHEVIQALVEKGADVGIKNKEGEIPLHCAASEQCVECVKLFLPVSDVNAQDSDGDTALHCSVLSDKPHSHEVIQALVEKGADVGIKNKEGEIPLHCAASKQCVECVKLFLPVSDVNAQDSDGDTALHSSVLSDEGHCHEVIQTLVEKGADVGIKNKEGETPLHCAARRQCIECVKLLLPVSDVNAQDSDGDTALHSSVLSDEGHCHEVIQTLVEKGADVGIKNKEGEIPLHCAASKQCVECVKLLLPVSDVNAQDSDGDTALHCSVLSDEGHCHEVIQTLVEKGADVGIKNKEGEIPLHCAAIEQCVECVKLLLPVSDVNAQDSDGDTALHSSLLSDKPHSHEVIQALVEKGADVGIKNKKDKTPLHCAARQQCLECVKLLLPVSDVNAQDSDGDTALHCSVLSDEGHCHEVIQTLVEKGADVGIKNKKDQTPLHCAARRQCMECVKLFLPVSDVNAQDSDGDTALHCSLLSDKPHSHEVIQALVEKGADVGIKNKKDKTPLHCAARQQCLECVKLLLPVSDVNAQDSDGDTALHCSVLSDKPHSHEVIQALVEKGADVRIKNKEGKTPLHHVHCAASEQCVECVKLLLPVSDVNAQDSDGDTALHCSVLSDKPHSHEVVQALVEKGADVGIKNKEGETPLHCAARQQCLECVKLLLPVSDVNAQDSDGDTALHSSVLSDEGHCHEVIQTLVEKGADVGIKNKKDQTPLHCAARRQCMECVKLFLPVSDVNAQDSDGDTALHCSLLSDKPHSHEVIQALVEKGADVGIKNKKDKTPLHCAARQQCLECVKLLLPVSDVNAQDSDGDTALHCSVLSDKPHSHEVIQALVEKGADVRIKNKEGKTPLHHVHCAASEQCVECVKLLLPVSDVNAQDSDGDTALHCSVLSDKPHSHEVVQALVEKGADVGIKNKEGETPLHCAARQQCIECNDMILVD
ncbi:uncharacterized protein LOC124112111 isoform X2 [Haliotis rufescens]|uniref:uncharacterized protein LOC124112111 isoform X2 n=1 Tax=Haliotis rufescens TaxID=6454 RepID=UPI00201F29E2|nr:uncharacterized protein LOC124112111 isoform X2 [Haliotis rufescens]